MSHSFRNGDRESGCGPAAAHDRLLLLLNKRLFGSKADEQSLKATIGELITATEIAERAIGRAQAHRARRQREPRQPAQFRHRHVQAT